MRIKRLLEYHLIAVVYQLLHMFRIMSPRHQEYQQISKNLDQLIKNNGSPLIISITIEKKIINYHNL